MRLPPHLVLTSKGSQPTHMEANTMALAFEKSKVSSQHQPAKRKEARLKSVSLNQGSGWDLRGFSPGSSQTADTSLLKRSQLWVLVTSWSFGSVVREQLRIHKCYSRVVYPRCKLWFRVLLETIGPVWADSVTLVLTFGEPNRSTLHPWKMVMKISSVPLALPGSRRCLLRGGVLCPLL